MFLALLIGFYILGCLVCSVVLIAITIANGRLSGMALSPVPNPKSELDLQGESLYRYAEVTDPRVATEKMMGDQEVLVDAV